MARFYSSAASTLLASVGVLTITFVFYQFASFVYLHFIRRSSLGRYLHPGKGNAWALVTGASDGIGLGFSEELLHRGFNVLLHGRNRTKLDGIVQRLSTQFDASRLAIVVCNASDADCDIDAVVKAAKALPGKLTVLVNNVGGSGSSPIFVPLEEWSASVVDELINLNARFPAQLSRALMPVLRQNSPGLVLNIGSAAGLYGMPWLSIYAASKAFNLRFSESLRLEAMANNIDVEILGVLVGNVISGGNKTGANEFFTCTSEVCASSSLDRVGCGDALVWCWWRHGLQGSLIQLVSASIRETFLLKVIGQHRLDHHARLAAQEKSK